MGTYRLHRTKDGATVTIPRDVLRLWTGKGAVYVHTMWDRGCLVLVPYTDDLKPCYPEPAAEEEPTSGRPAHQP